VRRNRKTGELAFYHCWMPRPAPLAVLVNAVGRRWCIEERIQTGKGLVGLDQHQVRRWRSWYRWTTLAMLAHALLVVLAATHRTRHPPPSDLIGLTCNELRHLFAALLARPAADAAPSAALVCVAAPTSGPRPHLPLPPASQRTMKVTVSSQQPADLLMLQTDPAEFGVDDPKLLAVEVELAQQRPDRLELVLGQVLGGQPRPAFDAE
jgi:hypothetical protein